MVESELEGDAEVPPISNPQPIPDGHKLNALAQQLAMAYTGGQVKRVLVEVTDAKGFVTRHSLG